VTWWENLDRVGTTWLEHTVDGSFDGAYSVYAADVDGDGDLDVLGAADEADDITWWENTGPCTGPGGLCTTWTEHAVDTSFDHATAVSAADVDGDGDLDVLGVSWYLDDVVWWENTNGAGTTWSERTLDSSFVAAVSVSAADVDGDGDLDVVGTAQQDNDVTWWENRNGVGTSWLQHTVDGDFNWAFSAVAADMDGDGDLDIAGGAVSDSIAWWENRNGAGTDWTAHTVDQGSPGEKPVTVADVDGDGDLDVLGADGDGAIAWWENTTIHRSATYPIEHAVDTDSGGANSITTADVDGDGDADLLASAFWASDIIWWENTDGAGSSWAEHTVDDAFDGASSAAAADVDGDGDLDVLGAANVADDITWWENTDGVGTTWTEHTVDANYDGAVCVTAADVDGDGDVDVLGAAEQADDITWWENTNGVGTAWSEHTVDGAFDGADSVDAADIDGDGHLDLLGTAHDADDITWWENANGLGTTWAKRTLDGAFDGASWVTAADVDSDGDLDVLGVAGTADDVAWWENTDGDGTSWALHTIDGTFDSANSVYAADVDSDGDLDVLGAAGTADDITWWENTGGDGTAWAEHIVDGDFDSATSVCAADVDGDGDLDVMGTAFWNGDITWWENRGGQIALETTDTAPAEIISGRMDDMLRIVASHRGRDGDADEELATLDLLLEESAGDPLTSMEANALIENLRIHVDDGSGVFESASDPLVIAVGTLSLSAGQQTITFNDGDQSLRVVHGTQRTYFVVAELTSNAHGQSPNSFRVTHITEESSTAEDRDHDIPLSLEYAANVASGISTANIHRVCLPIVMTQHTP
jgi:hypothetical protein